MLLIYKWNDSTSEQFTIKNSIFIFETKENKQSLKDVLKTFLLVETL